MDTLSDFIASKLLKIKAVKFQINNPFTWGTGWSSPIYFDDRKVLSYPATRVAIKLELARLVAEKYPDAEVIAGVTSSAIPFAIMVADELGLPFIYIHSEPKDHGFDNMIEGDLRLHQKVVLIENQIITAANSLKVYEAIRQNACDVLGLVALFDYSFDLSKKALTQINLEHTCLCDYNSIVRLAIDQKLISIADSKVLDRWYKNPEKWKK